MDLLLLVRNRLASLSPSDLRQIAQDVPGVSFSWLSQIARGKYQSEPAYSRLRSVAEWLERNPSAKVEA